MSILAKIENTVKKIALQFNKCKPHYTPIGTLLCFAGTTLPEGYLLCDGRAIDRTTYADLFKVIGTAYGTGDGSTTFNVPDFQNKTFWGGNSSSVGTVKAAGLPNITGSFGRVVRAIDDSSGCFTVAQASNRCPTSTTSTAFFWDVAINASRSNSIYGKSTTVQPPALVIQVIIKYL